MANIAYSNVIKETITITATASTGINQIVKRGISGVTENHVVIDDTFPPEIAQNATWITKNNGDLYINFEDTLWSTNISFPVYLGVPVNT